MEFTKDQYFVNARDIKRQDALYNAGYHIGGQTDKGFIFTRPGVQLAEKYRLRTGPLIKPQKRRGPKPHFDELKVNKTHRMTPTAHAWIEANKHKIEEMARQKKLKL